MLIFSLWVSHGPSWLDRIFDRLPLSSFASREENGPFQEILGGGSSKRCLRVGREKGMECFIVDIALM